MVNQPSKANSTLNSWKEIAVFFNRGVRTVQRWEQELGLPVHRVRATEHSPVFAYVQELELWLRSRVVAQVATTQPRQEQDSQRQDGARETLQRLRRLVRDLIEQRKQTQTRVHSLELTVQGLRERRKRRANYDGERTPVNPA